MGKIKEGVGSENKVFPSEPKPKSNLSARRQKNKNKKPPYYLRETDGNFIYLAKKGWRECWIFSSTSDPPPFTSNLQIAQYAQFKREGASGPFRAVTTCPKPKPAEFQNAYIIFKTPRYVSTILH